MKKRLFRILNFCALNILFFALYLNFIHKDNNTIAPVQGARSASMQQGASLVANPEQYIEKGPLNVQGKTYGNAFQILR